MLSTHQGSFVPAHVQSFGVYFLDCNRRTSSSRGLLFRRLWEQIVITPPVAKYPSLNLTNRKIFLCLKSLEYPPRHRRSLLIVDRNLYSFPALIINAVDGLAIDQHFRWPLRRPKQHIHYRLSLQKHMEIVAFGLRSQKHLRK